MQLWKSARPGDADTLAKQSERPVLIALRFITDTILHVSPVGASVDDIASAAHLDAYCPPRSPVWPLLSGTIENKIGRGKFERSTEFTRRMARECIKHSLALNYNGPVWYCIIFSCFLDVL